VAPDLRANFGPVVEEARVDLVLAGHEHFYERSEPSCVFSSGARVSHVTTGGGSAQKFLDPVRLHPNFPFSVSVPHFLRVRVTRDRLEVRAVDGAVLGKVDHLLATGGNDVLVLDRADRMIPFVPGSVIRSVDLEAGVIVADWQDE